MVTIKWGLKGDPETDADRRHRRVFWPAGIESLSADALEQRAAASSVVGKRQQHPAPPSTLLLRDLPALTEPAWVALVASVPARSVCLAVAEPTADPRAPRAPSARLLADLDPAGSA
jgi:hypothetical protein